MPSNRYSSVVRLLTAKNIYESVLPAIPADFTLTAANTREQILNVHQPIINGNSNLTIRKLGISSNFSDGLVFKEPGQRLTAVVNVYGAQAGTALTGNLSITAGSNVLTGIGTLFLAELAPGDIILFDPVPAGIPSSPRWLRVLAVVNDLQATLYNYSSVTDTNNGIVYPINATNVYALEDISVLNQLYEVNHFIPSALSTVAGSEAIIICDINAALRDGNVDFLTKSIDPTFSADKIHFDVLAEIEVTGS